LRSVASPNVQLGKLRENLSPPAPAPSINLFFAVSNPFRHAGAGFWCLLFWTAKKVGSLSCFLFSSPTYSQFFFSDSPPYEIGSAICRLPPPLRRFFSNTPLGSDFHVKSTPCPRIRGGTLRESLSCFSAWIFVFTLLCVSRNRGIRFPSRFFQIEAFSSPRVRVLIRNVLSFKVFASIKLDRGMLRDRGQDGFCGFFFSFSRDCILP